MYDYLIAVATVNGPQRLEAFLSSVREHTHNINYAISICDDCSNPDLASQNYNLAVKYNCFYKRNESRSGVPYSWNRACEAADSSFIVIANDDIVVASGWLEAANKFRENNKHLKLGVIAWPATNILNDISQLTDYTVNVDEAHIANPIVACSGYLFTFPRKLYAEVGGFDERYFATWEEIDFGAKLCMNGYKSVGINAPVIFHQGGASFSDPINQHPAMQKQSLAMSQWIEKWKTILNINNNRKNNGDIIKTISEHLVAKIPVYKVNDFNAVEISSLKARDDIHGWFDWEDIYTNVVHKYDEGIFVEVGSWMGKSACFLAESIKRSNKNIQLYCVDIWDDNYSIDNSSLSQYKELLQANTLLDVFKKNLSKYNVLEYVQIKHMTSLEAAKEFQDETLSFVFLDGLHDYTSVKNDLNAWYSKIKSGGTLAGHDFFWSPDGVQVAVIEFCKKHNLQFNTSNQAWYLRKP